MEVFKIRASSAGKISGIKGLGETGKTYCKKWLKEQLYNRKIEFSNKYTVKEAFQDNVYFQIQFLVDHLKKRSVG